MLLILLEHLIHYIETCMHLLTMWMSPVFRAGQVQAEEM